MKLILQSLLIFMVMSQVMSQSNCVAPGSFKEPRDPTCKKYYTCTLLLGMYYIKDDYTCGTLQRFNPTTQRCDFTSVCIDSFCDNQPPLATIPDPNALNPACRQTYIRCAGIINQYPIIEQCLSGCC